MGQGLFRAQSVAYGETISPSSQTPRGSLPAAVPAPSHLASTEAARSEGGEDEGRPSPSSRPPHRRRVRGAPRTRDAAGGGAPAVGRRWGQADGEVGSCRRRGSAPPPLLGLGSCSAAMRSGGDGAAGHSGRARGAAGR